MWLNNLLILGGCLVCVFAFAEICARVWLKFFASERQRFFYSLVPPEDIQIRFQRHHYLGYIPTPGYNKGGRRHNSLGFSGEEISKVKPAGVYRIVCIGGSTTYTDMVLDHKQSWPYLLQEALKRNGYSSVEVVNSGVPGWSSHESLINLHFRVLDLEPDLLIINHGVNDVSTRLVEPVAHKADNSGCREPLPTAYCDGLGSHSVVIRILKTRYGYRRPPFTKYAGMMEFVKTSLTREFQEQRKNMTYPRGRFAELGAIEIFRCNGPDYCERNIRSMIAIAHEYGIGVLLGTFAYSRKFPEEPRSGSDEYVEAFEQHNRMIKAIASEKNVWFFDLNAAVPDDREYWEDGRHVTLAGAKRKAEAIAEYLAENDIIPKNGRRPECFAGKEATL